MSLTFPSEDLGETYKRLNDTLLRPKMELKTDLTTLDGFMWFMSKKYECLLVDDYLQKIILTNLY